MNSTKKLMKMLTTPILGISLFCAATLGAAEEEKRPDHYKGEPSATLEQALTNFSEYNGKLHTILAKKELSAQDMHAVHELTYTLENALEKLREEFSELADVLEVVHLASESADTATVSEQGKAYLDTAQKIIK